MEEENEEEKDEEQEEEEDGEPAWRINWLNNVY